LHRHPVSGGRGYLVAGALAGMKEHWSHNLSAEKTDYFSSTSMTEARNGSFALAVVYGSVET
jgi:hypothetical protein